MGTPHAVEHDVQGRSQARLNGTLEQRLARHGHRGRLGFWRSRLGTLGTYQSVEVWPWPWPEEVVQVPLSNFSARRATPAVLSLLVIRILRSISNHPLCRNKANVPPVSPSTDPIVECNNGWCLLQARIRAAHDTMTSLMVGEKTVTHGEHPWESANKSLSSVWVACMPRSCAALHCRFSAPSRVTVASHRSAAAFFLSRSVSNAAASQAKGGMEDAASRKASPVGSIRIVWEACSSSSSWSAHCIAVPIAQVADDMRRCPLAIMRGVRGYSSLSRWGNGLH